MVGLGSIPEWLDTLLGESFFGPCLRHESSKKNEKNIFCLDCCASVCPQCLPSHRKHRLLQIRRYVYHDVLRLRDAEKLMDCSLVQSYITNSAKVVFLNQRPLTRLFRSSGNGCITCHRNLQDPYLFCCLSCKVQHVVSTQGGLETYLSQHQTETFSDLDDSPDSVLFRHASQPTSSCSSASSSGKNAIPPTTSTATATLLCTATTEFVKKKRSNISASRLQHRPKCPPATEDAGLNRRKSVPNRSPFY